jgi:tetratricopeptide (TPR) repeat protein
LRCCGRWSGSCPADDPRRQLLAGKLAQALSYRAAHDEVETVVGETLPHVTDPDVLVDLHDVLARSRGARRRRLAETMASIDHALVTFPGLTASARNRLRMIAARIHHQRKDNDSAERTARPVLAEATASGDRWAITGSANIVAAVLADRGDLAGALEYFDRGLAATEGQATLADQRLLLLANRGGMARRLDRFEQARADLLQARALAERTGNIRRLKSIQAGLCALYFGIGQWDDAIIEAELREDVEDVMFRLDADGVAAQIALHRQDNRTARQRLASARALFEQNGHPRGPPAGSRP